MLLEIWSLLRSLLISDSIKKKGKSIRASGFMQELQHCYRHKQEVLNHSKNRLQSDRHGGQRDALTACRILTDWPRCWEDRDTPPPQFCGSLHPQVCLRQSQQCDAEEAEIQPGPVLLWCCCAKQLLDADPVRNHNKSSLASK